MQQRGDVPGEDGGAEVWPRVRRVLRVLRAVGRGGWRGWRGWRLAKVRALRVGWSGRAEEWWAREAAGQCVRLAVGGQCTYHRGRAPQATWLVHAASGHGWWPAAS